MERLKWVNEPNGDGTMDPSSSLLEGSFSPPSKRDFWQTHLHPGPDSKKTGTMSVARPSLVFLLSKPRSAEGLPAASFSTKKYKTKKRFTVRSRHRLPLHAAVSLPPRAVQALSRPFHPRSFAVIPFFLAEPPAASLFSYFRHYEGGGGRASLVFLYRFLTIGTRV
jgi:hypothetical protein